METSAPPRGASAEAGGRSRPAHPGASESESRSWTTRPPWAGASAELATGRVQGSPPGQAYHRASPAVHGGSSAGAGGGDYACPAPLGAYASWAREAVLTWGGCRRLAGGPSTR